MTVAPSEIWQGRAIGDPETARLTCLAPPARGEKDWPAFAHFSQRVRERIGGGADPDALWCTLIHCIEAERFDLVRCLGRLNRRGRRVWQFRVPDGRTFFAVFDHRVGLPITVLTARQLEEAHAFKVRRISGRATLG